MSDFLLICGLISPFVVTLLAMFSFFNRLADKRVTLLWVSMVICLELLSFGVSSYICHLPYVQAEFSRSFNSGYE